MFFNDDILYRNGSLALVWLVGNDGLREKNKRNKDFKKALSSSVFTICEELRKLLPQMGTAYGVSLKKMAVLVTGAQTIYCIKINQLAKDVVYAMLNLTKPIIIANPRIDMPPPGKSKSKRKVNARNEDEEPFSDPNITTAFGNISDMPDQFGVTSFSNAEIGFGTPRALPSAINAVDEGPIPPFRLLRTPPPEQTGVDERRRRKDGSGKKRRGENDEESLYGDVLARLQRTANENPAAHCLIEDNGLHGLGRGTEQDFLFGEREGGDLFGDGMALLNEEGMSMAFPAAPRSEVTERGDVERQVQLQLPPTSDFGFESILESRSENQLTPPRAGTQAENTRRRRNEGRPDLEDSPPPIQLENVQEVRGLARGRGRPRRRLQLLVDEETNMTLREMLARIRAIQSETNVEALWEQIRSNDAPPKSKWKTVPVISSLDFIRSSGRTLGGTLSKMQDDIIKGQTRRRPITDSMIEERRDKTNQSNAGISGGQTLHGGLQPSGASIMPSTVFEPPSLQPQTPDREGREQAEPLVPQESAPERCENNAMHPLDPGFDDPLLLPNEFGGEGNNIIAQEEEFPFPPPATKRPRRDSRSNDQGRLAGRLDGEKTFADLYPLAETRKREAARAFLTLLKLQVRKDVALAQREPYGDIFIERLDRSV